MLTGLLFGIGSAILYTGVNLIAYGEVVDGVNESSTKNKENKGLKKFFTGAKNVLAKVIFFPAFTSKAIIDSNTPENKIDKKLKREAKAKSYSAEKVELARKLAESRLEEQKSKNENITSKDCENIVNKSYDLAGKYFDVKQNLKDTINAFTEKYDLELIEKRFAEGKYDLVEDTTSHKESMKTIKTIILKKMGQLQAKLGMLEAETNYKRVEEMVLPYVEKMPDEALESDILFTNAIARVLKKEREVAEALKEKTNIQEIANDSFENVKSKIQKEYERQLDYNQTYLPVYEKLLRMYDENPSLTLDQIIENNNLKIIELGSQHKDKKLELQKLVKELALKETIELELMETEKCYEILTKVIEENGLEESNEIENVLALAAELSESEKEAQKAIKELETMNLLCEFNLKALLDSLIGLDDEITPDVICSEVRRYKSLALEKEENLKETKDLFEEFKQIHEDYLKMMGLENKETVSEELDYILKYEYSYNSTGYYHLENMLNVYFLENEEAYKILKTSLDQDISKCAEIDGAFEKELGFQTQLAVMLCSVYGHSMEEAIAIMNEDFVTDLSHDELFEDIEEDLSKVDLEVENAEIDDLIEEVKTEETQKNVVEETIEEAVEEVKKEEAEITEPIILAQDLTGTDAKVTEIKVAPKTKKVTYQKYEAVTLSEENFNKLNEKQKYIYSLICEYGSAGLPVGIFTAMGIKMNQIKKFIKPVDGKYEAEYTTEEQAKVLKIINDELNNDLYLATNGNERIKVVRTPIETVKVTKDRIEVLENINSKYKVCLVKGLTEVERKALKEKYGSKIEFHKDYIIFSSREEEITKDTQECLSR